MRFEWLALLAFKRATEPTDQAWVTLHEVARLPKWAGRSEHHIATNLGRYLQSPEVTSRRLVSAAAKWSGPYRLNLDALSISFDIPMAEVRRKLRLRSRPTVNISRPALLRFTLSYARARWLVFQGRLVQNQTGSVSPDNAYDRLAALSMDRSSGSVLRLLACLSAADVLFRRGRIGLARKLLLENTKLVRKVTDSSLKAQFHLRLAWAYQRASTGPHSDRAVRTALSRASFYAENSGDRASLGLLAFRTGLYLTKKRDHQEAINQLLIALEAFLITGNYDQVQSTCGNIGSIIHRMGRRSYPEAREWLLAGMTISRWMDIGRDDAHGEMILGKMYIETGKKTLSGLWLDRAERVATSAGNQINVADVKMVRGFWESAFGTRKAHINTLLDALRIFRSLREFDCTQKERYMERKFPEVWDEVIERAKSKPRPPSSANGRLPHLCSR
jgi:tetratricopeptide (TPR) repeat protein